MAAGVDNLTAIPRRVSGGGRVGEHERAEMTENMTDSINEAPPAHLLSAAAALERILARRYPEHTFIVSVRETASNSEGDRP